MVDYDFYVNSYLGSAIPETAFPEAIQRASQALRRFKRLYHVAPAADGSEKLALCAMAEAAYAASCRGVVTSASMGQVSVHYDQTQKNVERQMYQQALNYLDIYRGVGA